MATVHPVTDVRFELDSYCDLFDSVAPQQIGNGNLLVVATKHGTRIIGHPSSHELQILYFNDRTHMPRSKYKLRGTPSVLSLNRKEDLLAVNCKFNDLSFLEIFSVNSFMSSEDLRIMNSKILHCMAKDISWSPCSDRLFAILLGDGSLIVCSFDDKFESKRIERDKARCICWSSRTSEIVVALPNGVLKLHDLEKPTLKRTITSPSKLFGCSYEPIALQWLSSNQFAVVFLESASNARPKLYIINTIGEQPSYIRVDDTCYSPGEASVYLIHMPMWNLILTGSKNDARINILVADGSTEPPSWMQLSFVDESRTRLPLEIEDDGPLLMLGIALENKADQLAKETPLLSAILTSGRLLTIKLKLSTTVAAQLYKHAFGANHYFPHSHLANAVKAPIEQRFVADNFSTFEGLAPSQSLPARGPGDATPNIFPVQEMITEPARILQSAIRSSLDVTKYSNGYSEKWLEYLRSLATALESTLDEMEHLKGDLHSLMATLSETKPIVREKMGLPCLESQDSTADNLQVIEMEIEVIETSLENLEMSPSSARKKRVSKPKEKSPSESDADSRQFACSICGRRYTTAKSMLKHVNAIHANSPKVSGSTIKRAIEAEQPIGTALEVSQVDTLSGERRVPKIVLKIGKTGTKKISKQNKQKRSSKQKKQKQTFACDECDTRYAKKYNLDRHTRTIQMKSATKEVATSPIESEIIPELPQIDAAPQQSESDTLTNSEFDFSFIGTTTPKMDKSKQKTAKSHPFMCDICGMRYVSKSGLKGHVHKIHVPNLSKRTPAGKENQPVHNRPSSSRKIAKVNRDGKRSSKSSDLKNAEYPPFECKMCGARYKHMGRFDHHMRNDHASGVVRTANRRNNSDRSKCRYKCVCAYATDQSGNFSRHQRICKTLGSKTDKPTE